MAADTKDSKTSKTFLGHSNSSVSVGKTYDTFDYPATKDNLNSLPGANAHGPPASAGLIDALKSIKLEDFKEVHKKPCTREGFLTGIGAGFGIGGIRAILGGMYHGMEAEPRVY